MDFGLTPEQELLRETARALLARECPTSLLRAHIEDPGAADSLTDHLREFAGLGVAPLVDRCVFLEELGYVAAPGPFVTTTVLFTPLLEATRAELLDDAVAGSVAGTVALAGRDGVWAVNADPVKTFVPEADRVDRVAVVGPGPRVAIVESPPCRPIEWVDFSRRVFAVDVAAGARGDRVDPAALADVVESATVAFAAELVGTARRLFDMTLAYAKERHQFGVPIGSFQAMQHKLADMALDLERSWSAVYYAAMALDADDRESHRAVHVAKAAAGEAAKRCLKDGIQIHGGIGYTWEHDLHLFIRRATAGETFLGTTGWHHDRLADLLI